MHYHRSKNNLLRNLMILLVVIIIFTGFIEITGLINKNHQSLETILKFFDFNQDKKTDSVNFNIQKKITVIGLDKIKQSQWDTWVVGIKGMVDPQLIREKLLLTPWIKDTQIIRKNINEFIIIIEENIPTALQQESHEFYILFADGQRDPISNPNKYNDLPLVIGLIDDSNIIKDIQELQNFCPEDFGSVKAIRRVNNRRWDIILDNSLVIKLNKDKWRNRKKDLQKLSKAGFAILNNKNRVKTLDLRIPNIVIVQEKKYSLSRISLFLNSK